MGHHDHHEHDHHHHDHDHSDHHSKEELTFADKARKLLEHWIHHNEDHASSYRQWSETFKENDLPDAAELLLVAAQATTDINRNLEQALNRLEGKK
jgi:phytoene/squalene synthetase